MDADFLQRAKALWHLIGEAELPEPSDIKDEEEGEGDEGDEMSDEEFDEEPLEQPEPVEVASPNEQLYTSIAIDALMFDPENVRPKDLTIYDSTNPEEILNSVRRIIGSNKTLRSLASTDTKNETGGGSSLPGSDGEMPTDGPADVGALSYDAPFLSNRKYTVARLILKALRYSPDELIMQDGLVSSAVSGENAEDFQNQLEALIGHQPV